MAYQNVGTPRFYIDYFQLAMANGTGSLYSAPSPLGLNASKQYSYSTGYDPPDIYKIFQIFNFTGAIPKLNYIAILGHNLGSFATGGFHMRLDSDTVSNDYVEYPSDYEIVNTGFSGDNFYTHNNGFSIVKITEPSTPEMANRIVFRLQGSEAHNIKVSAISTGSIYDLPSPDLKLTMTREMDGVKRIRTKGGVDLVKYQHTKPPPWGSLAPWELTYSNVWQPDQALSRIGRRVWDLSFSYLSDSDVFPDVSNLNNYGTSGYSDGDDTTLNTLLDGDDFYSQVIHKTMGAGNLPFIFNPAGGGDNPNNNPDMFAICKFDQSSFSFQQISPSLYSVKMKIREIW